MKILIFDTEANNYYFDPEQDRWFSEYPKESGRFETFDTESAFEHRIGWIIDKKALFHWFYDPSGDNIVVKY